MNPTHTPKWTVDMIAHATDEMARSGKSNERAEFCVRAVNAHDAMLEALKRVHLLIKNGAIKINNDKAYPSSAYGISMEIAEAIAKAEGK